ncbi:hypothetical protein ACIQUQ_15445 [Streptomyces sp. NPDC101118]|uniref:Rv1733c family protein n=1 Tax=Streptomyces sp. NPDC101118 TaxID=3366109 RepID=UPI003800A74F
MRTAMGVWRWRHNPLRRTTDLIEAWVALAALACFFLLVPAVGTLAGTRVDDVLQQAVRSQHAERTLINAVVTAGSSAAGAAASGRAADSADPGARRHAPADPHVVASWTAPDGSHHTGTVATGTNVPGPGQAVPVWTDDRGRLVGRPLDTTTAATHSALAGLAAAATAAALVATVRRLIVRRLTHRRYARLDRAWAAAGPDWGRTDAGG